MYKDILVHIDTSDRTQARLDLAISLAKRFNARLSGVFGQLESNGPSIVARRASEKFLSDAESCKELFIQAIQSAYLDGGWIQIPHGEQNFLLRELVIYSRYADLVIVGQYDDERDRGRQASELNEELVKQSGVPILVVPHSGLFNEIGTRIMVAWNGSRECARAVHDSMPFISEAERVRVLGLHSRPEEDIHAPIPNIAWRLSRFEAEVHYDVIDPQDARIMDAIISRCTDVEADLLVMGAYGHLHDLPFISRGEGTEYILKHLAVPTLFSH